MNKGNERVLSIDNNTKQRATGYWSRIIGHIKELESSGGPKIGYFYLLLANFISPLSSWCIQQLNGIPLYQLLFFRGIILFSINWIICSTQNIEFYTKSPSTNMKLLSRGLASLVSFGLAVVGLNNLSLSEATTLFQTAPVFANLFAMYFLKEKFDSTQGITMIMSLLGTLLVLKPPFLFGSDSTVVNNEDQNRFFGGMCSLVTALMAAGIINLLRNLRNHCHSQTTVHYTAVVTTLATPVPILFQGVAMPTMQQYVFILLMGVLMGVSQMLTTRAVKFSTAGKSSILGYSQILFSFIIDVLSGNTLDFWSIIGAGCIFSCMFIIFFEKKK